VPKPFSGFVTTFHERVLPERGVPAGYAALIEAYDLQVPMPRRLTAIGEKHKIVERDGWRLLTPRHAPRPTLEGHLVFALKYEGLDLAVLRRLFMTCGPDPITAMLKARPTGAYGRRLWFLYEWLLAEKLPLANIDRGSYVPVVDPDQQFAGAGEPSPRHRVRNNLPGTPAFCPLVFRTERLNAFVASRLDERASAVVAAVPKDLLARAAAFLLLNDSKASYAIEGERPPQDRIQRWGRVIGEAGRHPLDLDELLRLQRIVIEDARFIHMGLRVEGGFVGEHDRDSHAPLPDHISARPEDLDSLLAGMIDFDSGAAKFLDPVVAAASLAFGFVLVHPFEDGNGRIHRYLIHHVLAERGFNPPGVVFPVSSVILGRIEDYRAVLESSSARFLPVIEWQATDRGNVRVLNETADFYRYFDATLPAEFLFACVERTIGEDLPREVEFLRRHDRFRAEVNSLIDMPDRSLDLLFRFLMQNNGRLSKRARESEFAALTSAEVEAIEKIYTEPFGRNSG
jgi:Fic/DOC family